MKFLIALGLVATVTSAYAAERKIYDVMYLPKAGTIYGISQLSYSHGKTEYNHGLGRTNTDAVQVDQTVGYSVLENFSLSASAHYLDSQSESGNGVADQSKVGISDPTIGGRYRIFENTSILDVIANVGVSLGDGQIKNNSNNLQGGNTAQVGVQWGQQAADFQWSVLGAYTRFMDGTVETSGTDVDYDSYGAYLVRGDILSQIDETAFFRGYLSAVVADEIKGNHGFSTGSTVTYTLGGEYQHLCSANFMLKAGLNYNLITGNDVDQNDAVKALVGANYQF